MSGHLFLFEEEEFQPSSQPQRDAARKEIAERKSNKPKEPEENQKEEAHSTTNSVREKAEPANIKPQEEEEPLQSWESKKQYHSISEVAKLFGLNVSHIRHWTTEFKIKVRKTRKGDRLYNEQNIREIGRIYQLMKKEGMTIKGTKNKINQLGEVQRREQLIADLKVLYQQLKDLSKHFEV